MEDGDGVKDNIEVIEYFSGVGRVAKLADHVGYKAVAFDMDDGVATAKRSGRRNPLDLNSNGGFVLAVKLILRSRFNAVIGLFAILCSSFVPVNRGTGSRDLLVPEGDEQVVSVRKSNKLVSRNLECNVVYGDFLLCSIDCLSGVGWTLRDI